MIDLKKAKVICCFIGRYDLEQRGVSFVSLLEELLATIRRFNKSAALFISGPIPAPSDSKKQVASCVMAGKASRAYCARLERVQYSRFAEQMYDKQGVHQYLVQGQQYNKTALNMLARHVKSRWYAAIKFFNIM